jgi:alpha,alpha-trehalase
LVIPEVIMTRPALSSRARHPLHAVCLNSLLYRMETQASRIEEVLGDEMAARPWDCRAKARRAATDKYVWDEPSGLYLDYDFETRQRRNDPFGTTFYPLWAGLASRAQAAACARTSSCSRPRAGCSRARARPATSGTRRSDERRCR